MRVQVKELKVNGDLLSNQINVLWRNIDSPHVEVTFWTRNMDWLPDVNAIYEYTPPSKQGTFKLIEGDQQS